MFPFISERGNELEVGLWTPCKPALVKLLILDIVSDGVSMWQNVPKELATGLMRSIVLPRGIEWFRGIRSSTSLAVSIRSSPPGKERFRALSLSGLVTFETSMAESVAGAIGLWLSVSLGLVIEYRQNSCPSKANDESVLQLFASRKASGNLSWTGSSSLER